MSIGDLGFAICRKEPWQWPVGWRRAYVLTWPVSFIVRWLLGFLVIVLILIIAIWDTATERLRSIWRGEEP